MSEKHKLLLAYMYETRDMLSSPSDWKKVTLQGISQALEIKIRETNRLLNELKEKALVRSFRMGKIRYYCITVFGIADVEKQTESWIKGEVSTSRMGLEFGKSHKKSVL